MCGIGGILFSKDSDEPLLKRVKQIEQAQLHRGPDDRQTAVHQNHAFCHQRLALLDEKGGKQPFYDASERYLIVYNGEIYNYEDLRKELSNAYQFITRSDTEVVLAAYLVWGEDCLNRFIGMFSFLIWDTHTETAFAAVDPLSVKPFVYYQAGEEFVFASEVKGILASLDRKPSICIEALTEYVVAPMLSGVENTIYRGIAILQGGEKLHISKDKVVRSSYYNFTQRQGASTREQFIRYLGYNLEESIKMALKADFPVASFFSGGLDSSILSALALRNKTAGHRAFTVKFQDHEKIIFSKSSIVNSDDFPYAKQLAEDLKLPMQAVTMTNKSILSALNNLAIINDRIPAWEQEFSQHFLSQAASKDFKAVLVGDAADETNYGYFFLLNPQVNHSPSGLLQRFGGEQRASLLSKKIQKEIHPTAFLNKKYTQLVERNGFSFSGNQQDKILAMSCLIYKRWLGRLLHNGDIHSMNFGLEARVPFANKNLLEVVSHIGPEMGFKNENEKYLLRMVAKNWLPDYITNRKKSALPRDPRLGAKYQAVLKSLLLQMDDFVEDYLNLNTLSALCELKTIEENDRMMLFNMICLLKRVQHDAE
ncbi:asparagine synthetase [glutamine-hydrolyzing] 3 [Marivirga lumbricoides]|uniref:asparagine synthase (glutamine-hydrolyzing) n=1 Tax=Marivirga lumbricoides TaxID=1046115 RepID=A0ABQ1MUR3_9BACT|nr:asparagine synthetase [glutamine-hydrolyzing] 3 [Marivirga lumbricoides]